jgi:hypothetical protein
VDQTAHDHGLRSGQLAGFCHVRITAPSGGLEVAGAGWDRRRPRADASPTLCTVNGEIHCTHCGATGLQQGFVEDKGQGSRGYAQWVAGALELGVFGFARVMGKSRSQIDAFRCPQCGHLELFTLPPR